MLARNMQQSRHRLRAIMMTGYKYMRVPAVPGNRGHQAEKSSRMFWARGSEEG